MDRYFEKGGKVFELVRADPNEERELDLSIPRLAADELNRARAAGGQEAQQEMRRSIGIWRD